MAGDELCQSRFSAQLSRSCVYLASSRVLSCQSCLLTLDSVALGRVSDLKACPPRPAMLMQIRMISEPQRIGGGPQPGRLAAAMDVFGCAIRSNRHPLPRAP